MSSDKTRAEMQVECAAALTDDGLRRIGEAVDEFETSMKSAGKAIVELSELAKKLFSEAEFNAWWQAYTHVYAIKSLDTTIDETMRERQAVETADKMMRMWRFKREQMVK